MCNHTDLDECKCPCHEVSEDGQPKIIHIISCCEFCEYCHRYIDKQVEGFIS